MTATVSKLN